MYLGTELPLSDSVPTFSIYAEYRFRHLIKKNHQIWKWLKEPNTIWISVIQRISLMGGASVTHSSWLAACSSPRHIQQWWFSLEPKKLEWNFDQNIVSHLIWYLASSHLIPFHLIPSVSPRSTHWGRDKMGAISQATFSSAFSWMKMFEFWLKFHCNMFLKAQLTIF